MSNDLVISFTNPSNRHIISPSDLLFPDASFIKFSRVAIVAATGISVGTLAFTFAPFGLGNLAYGTLINSDKDLLGNKSFKQLTKDGLNDVTHKIGDGIRNVFGG